MARNTYGNMAGAALGAGQAAGLFNPMGSPAILAALKRRAARSAANMRRRGSVLSRLMGLGPQESQQAIVDMNREASGGMANALNEAEYNELTSGRNWMRELLGQERGYEFQKSMQPGIGATLGQIGGTALGSWAGGGFAMPGRKKQNAGYDPYEY